MQQFGLKAVLIRLCVRMHHGRDDQDETQAIGMLVSHYDKGEGVPQDSSMARQLWMKAVRKYYNYKEQGVEKDDKEELHHLEEAAMLGDAAARCELGRYEGNKGYWDRAKKHYQRLLAVKVAWKRSKRERRRELLATKSTRKCCVFTGSHSI